jgi:hypothetical protein
MATFAGTAAAATRATFQSHGWGICRLGQTVYPHAFIRLEGNPRTWKPAGFMKETCQLNAAVVRLPAPRDQPAGQLPDEPGPTPGDRAPGAL